MANSLARMWRSIGALWVGLGTMILAAEHPNILLVLADDLGFGDVACYNPEAKVATPHLDRLADEGLRFTDAHSPATVCTPSRYSLLTGRMAFRIPFQWVFTGAGGPCLIEDGRLTLPGLLQEKGYRTALVGKWHVGLSFPDAGGRPVCENGPEAVERIDWSRRIPDGPIDRGFDEFFGTACCPTTDWIYAFIEQDRVPVPPRKLLERSNLPEHPWSFDCREGWVAPDFDLEEIDEIFLRRSVSFLREHVEERKDQPFFLMHSTQAVHLPSFPSKHYAGSTSAGPHGDFIAQLDGHVGTLLDTLEQLGLAGNTLVVVTSDNGPEVGTVLNMRADYGHDGARPWRGLKRDSWEGGHRVPMLVRWPGVAPAGRTIRQTVGLIDLFATCADLVGHALPADAGEDSVSLLPLLRGEDETVREFILHQSPRLDLGIRHGPWKYLDHKGSGGNVYDGSRKGEMWKGLAELRLADTAPDEPGQLYDLAVDPGETVNLVGREPDRAAMLKKLLDEVRQSGRSVPMPRDPEP
jgi:arylsulfatase A-like enzyme